MGRKTWCPGCDSLTSSLNECFDNGWDCENCGLSYGAWEEVVRVRQARDDDELSQRFSELRIENDKLKRELTEAQRKLDRIRQSVERAIE